MREYIKIITVAAIVSSIWAVLAINAFTFGIHLGEQTCADRG